METLNEKKNESDSVIWNFVPYILYGYNFECKKYAKQYKTSAT
jgi:hypothetical protein